MNQLFVVRGVLVVLSWLIELVCRLNQEFLEVQHHDDIQRFLFHIVSFIKQCYFIDALRMAEDFSKQETFTASMYHRHIATHQLGHIVGIIEDNLTAEPVRKKLTKRLSSVRRSLPKRFESFLKVADI